MTKLTPTKHLFQDMNWTDELLQAAESSIYEEIVIKGEIVGHYRITKRKLNKLPFYTMKITFGPVIDFANLNVLDVALKQIIATTKKYKAVSIQVHPFVWDIELDRIRDVFYKNGFNRVKYYVYEATMLIDLSLTEEEIFKNFENRGKEAVRQSVRRGITAMQVELSKQNFDRFYQLYFDTCKRTMMIPEAKESIYKIIDKFSAKEKVFLFMSYFEQRPVSAFIAFDCGNCLSLIYQGSDYSQDIQKRRPANGLYWETIKWAKQHSYKWFDLAGVNANPLPGSKSEGIRLYKRQFGCKYVEFPGNFEYVNRPLIKLMLDRVLPLYSKFALRKEKKKHYG